MSLGDIDDRAHDLHGVAVVVVHHKSLVVQPAPCAVAVAIPVVARTAPGLEHLEGLLDVAGLVVGVHEAAPETFVAEDVLGLVAQEAAHVGGDEGRDTLSHGPDAVDDHGRIGHEVTEAGFAGPSLVLGLASLGHVVPGAHDAPDHAVGVGHGSGQEVHPPPRSRGQRHARLELDRLAGQHLGQDVPEAVQIVGVDQAQEATPRVDLHARVAEVSRRRLRRPADQQLPFVGHVEDGGVVRHQLRDEPVALLALLQRDLGQLALGGVAATPQDAHDAAVVVVPHGPTYELSPHFAAVRVDQSELVAHGLPGRQPGQHFESPPQVVGVHEAHQAGGVEVVLAEIEVAPHGVAHPLRRDRTVGSESGDERIVGRDLRQGPVTLLDALAVGDVHDHDLHRHHAPVVPAHGSALARPRHEAAVAAGDLGLPAGDDVVFSQPFHEPPPVVGRRRQRANVPDLGQELFHRVVSEHSGVGGVGEDDGAVDGNSTHAHDLVVDDAPVVRLELETLDGGPEDRRRRPQGVGFTGRERTGGTRGHEEAEHLLGGSDGERRVGMADLGTRARDGGAVASPLDDTDLPAERVGQHHRRLAEDAVEAHTHHGVFGHLRDDTRQRRCRDRGVGRIRRPAPLSPHGPYLVGKTACEQGIRFVGIAGFPHPRWGAAPMAAATRVHTILTWGTRSTPRPPSRGVAGVDGRPASWWCLSGCADARGW